MNKYTSKLFSETDLKKAVEEKLVTRSIHPDFPELSIFKYTKTAQYRRLWDDVTLNCRGLVLNTETKEIVARPFPKFFNYGELTEEILSENARGSMFVAEKLDGSLIIGFDAPDGVYRFTTAGGFQSPQGKAASRIYAENYEGLWDRRSDVTYMWEFISPKNRIVVDYGDTEGLYLLGAVDNSTGTSIPLNELTEWKWGRAEEYAFETLQDVLKAPERDNAEGYIIHFPDTDFRIKLKHEEYVRLHRDSTGLNERRVWDALRNGRSEEVRENLQEEFHDFFDEVSADLMKKFNTIYQGYSDAFEAARASFTGSSRIEWVEHVRNSADEVFVSTLLSNYDNDGDVRIPPVKINRIWDSFKPEGGRSVWEQMTENLE